MIITDIITIIVIIAIIISKCCLCFYFFVHLFGRDFSPSLFLGRGSGGISGMAARVDSPPGPVPPSLQPLHFLFLFLLSRDAPHPSL